MPTEIRARLEDLARQRGDLHEARYDLERRIAQTLLEVRETYGVTITAACATLGLSRPTAYRLLEEAQR